MSAIGICCRNSAKMLEIADDDRPALQKHNHGQAELLRKAADMADEQEALVADLLAALKLALAIDPGYPNTPAGRDIRDNVFPVLRAAIAKAEGNQS